MKISIITVSYNSQDTIEDTIRSVLAQSYKDIEYIIVDGRSSDNTLDIVDKYKDKISNIISEEDSGIYDAMNKGIRAATGDIVGILNSDDLYINTKAISTVVKTIKDKEVDCCWGDLVYVNKYNADKVIRYWKSSEFKEGLFKIGWMPPHPSFFVKREVYDKFGVFDLNFPISADYELMLRFLERHKIEGCYIPEILVKMREGGNSRPSLINTFRANRECHRAQRKNGLKLNSFLIIKKPLSKIKQFLNY
ncbi:MAG: glycosyltransferase [Candidatus Omnitrophica bacterium]|nr:glycosyltransferase [Candidatus Omnitrophota bacterium]